MGSQSTCHGRILVFHFVQAEDRVTREELLSTAGQPYAPLGTLTSVQFISVNRAIHLGNLVCRLCFSTRAAFLLLCHGHSYIKTFCKRQ